MPRKSYTIEQIISKLREAEVFLSQGQAVGGYLPVIQYQRINLLPLVERIRWDPDGSSAPVKGIGERECPTQKRISAHLHLH